MLINSSIVCQEIPMYIMEQVRAKIYPRRDVILRKIISGVSIAEEFSKLATVSSEQE